MSDLYINLRDNIYYCEIFAYIPGSDPFHDYSGENEEVEFRIYENGDPVDFWSLSKEDQNSIEEIVIQHCREDLQDQKDAGESYAESQRENRSRI